MTTPDPTPALPLNGVRVLDLTDGRGEACGRLLADLGADVVLVEPLGGVRSRYAEPVVDGVGLGFAVHAANKRSVELDWTTPDGRDHLLRLVAAADIMIESTAPDALSDAGLGVDLLRQHNPRLVITSVTEFGHTGPYRDWAGTDWVHMALNGVLSRSGLPDREPLLPPGRLAGETAAVQATWATLVAYWDAISRGYGEHVDVSVFEASTQTMDPAFGIAGSATGGVPEANLPPGRPDAGFRYPIVPCADGFVRLCVLSPRQWRAMWDWLGGPEEFADPKYDVLLERFAAWSAIGAAIERQFADRTCADLVADGQKRGVPIESVRAAGDVLTDPHFVARDVWRDVPLGSDLSRTGRVPHGFLEYDGERAGRRTPPPALGSTAIADVWPEPSARLSTPDPADPPDVQLGPLAGLRVLDLGVIVVGAETGRLFADQGAEVIKIESRQFPDGSRQSGRITPSFAWGHRNKRSLGLDLRAPEGRELFLRLVGMSDVVLSNFKPGTLDSLGLDDATLRSANPRIVLVESSALGRSGPDSRRMGYGPLVRAATGLTGLWRYPDQADGFCDAITVYPDHSASRVGAVGALAALLHRRRTGSAGRVDVAQAEVMLAQFGAELLRESLEPGTLIPRGNVGEFDAPYGLYRCAGDDEWCVITVRGDADWGRLCAAVDAPDLAGDPALLTSAGRVAQRERIDARLGEWTRRYPPREVMRRLQAAGVPAGSMNRINELRTDPHLRARRFFTAMPQPSIGDIPTENGPARFGRLPEPPGQPAPAQGEHTLAIARDRLGLDAATIDRLVADDVLQPPDRPADG